MHSIVKNALISIPDLQRYPKKQFAICSFIQSKIYCNQFYFHIQVQNFVMLGYIVYFSTVAKIPK